MNPLTNVKNLQKLNQRELELGLTNKKSWHDKYKDSAWIFVGGLPYDLTEGDIVCVFSQYGEIVNINLVRDQKTGKSKGYCFICYEDQRSTILSVDNLNGTKVLGRTLRVDHVEEYRKPKEHGDEDELTMKIRAEGVAPRAPEPVATRGLESAAGVNKKDKTEKVKKKKHKEEKKKKRETKTKADSDSSSDNDTEMQSKINNVKVKKERLDPGYDNAVNVHEKVREDKRDSGRRKKRSLSPDDRLSSPNNSRHQEQASYKHRTDRSETERHRNNDKSWDIRGQERHGDDTYQTEYRPKERNEYNNDYRTESETRNRRRDYDSRRETLGTFNRDRDFDRGNKESQRYNDRSRDYDRNNRGYRERR